MRTPDNIITTAGKILIMPSPAIVHKVEIVIILEIAHPSSKARIFDNIQAAAAAKETGKDRPSFAGKKYAQKYTGIPLNRVGTSL